MVVEHGLTASTIARKLFEAEYGQKKTKAIVIERVKHALDVALKRGLLKLFPPPETELQDQLAQNYKPVEITVVQDTIGYDETHAASPVCLPAARTNGK